MERTGRARTHNLSNRSHASNYIQIYAGLGLMILVRLACVSVYECCMCWFKAARQKSRAREEEKKNTQNKRKKGIGAVPKYEIRSTHRTPNTNTWIRMKVIALSLNSSVSLVPCSPISLFLFLSPSLQHWWYIGSAHMRLHHRPTSFSQYVFLSIYLFSFAGFGFEIGLYWYSWYNCRTDSLKGSHTVTRMCIPLAFEYLVNSCAFLCVCMYLFRVNFHFRNNILFGYNVEAATKNSHNFPSHECRSVKKQRFMFFVRADTYTPLHLHQHIG